MSIASMKLVKCKQELVVEQLSKLGLPTDGTLRQVVERLSTYYEENEEQIQLADCTTCGGGSDEELSACPFCGTEGPVEVQPGQQPEVTEEAEEAEEQPPSNDGEEEGEDAVGKSGSKASKKKAVKAPAPKARAAAKEAKAPKEAPAPKATKAKAAKGAKAALAEAPAGDGHDEALNGEIVDEAPGTALVNVAELDEQVRIIRATSAEGGVLYHKLGTALNTISKQDLWKLRLGPDSVPLYKSFRQFCTDELGSTPQHAYRAMNVAEHLTEEQVRGLSTKQIRVIMQLPDSGQRAELLADAKGGKATSQLTEKANALRGKPGKIKPDESTPEAKRKVTVALVQGQHRLKMYARPNTGGTRVGDIEGAKRAKKIGDNPWAVMDLENDVRMIIRVQPNPNSGELACVVEFRRGKSPI